MESEFNNYINHLKSKFNIYHFQLYKEHNIQVYNVLFSNINTKHSLIKHYPLIDSVKENNTVNINNNNIIISKHM